MMNWTRKRLFLQALLRKKGLVFDDRVAVFEEKAYENGFLENRIHIQNVAY